nr:beta-ketoacyl synthase N-terminal-like domain-containing protein [Streptomyces sp. DSM 40484]
MTSRTDQATTASDTDTVAIVGMGMVVPGCSSPEQFWKVLQQEQPQYSLPGDRWDLATLQSDQDGGQDRIRHRRMGYIHQDFAAHPGTDDVCVPQLDEFGRWLRHSVLQALDGVATAHGTRCLVSVGATAEGSQRLEESLVAERAARMMGAGPSPADPLRRALRSLYPRAAADSTTYLPHRQVRDALGDLLPRINEISVIDSACATASYTIDMGWKALLAGECDLAVCAASFVLSRRTNVLFSQMGGYADSGDLRAYDRAACGTMFSDGAAAVVLKRHAQAVSDGDHILATVLASGGSTDGRGKGIIAPNPTGQLRALTRAMSRAAVTPRDVQWVVGHGTGTKVGDARELQMLRTAAGDRAHWQVTSNKSLVGHTGWAAGIVSVIHAVLGLRHQQIPAQQRYDAVRDPGMLGRALSVPTLNIEWPAQPGRPRVAAVCAYGLGGTNCCVLIADDAPRPAPAAAKHDVVVSAYHAHLPGLPDRSATDNWLRTGNATWPDTFATPYPPLPGSTTTLPPSTHRSLDRSHLMTLHATRTAVDAGTLRWGDAERTGVFLAHLGPTHGSIEYALRVSADDLARRLTEHPTADARLSPDLVARRAREQVARGDSDTFTGFIGNVMASRVAVQFDLHGQAASFDAGRDSLLAALHAARRSLSSGDLDFALVLAVAANAAGGDMLREPGTAGPVREGVFILLLASADSARTHKLPVLARVEAVPGTAPHHSPGVLPGHRGFLGADSAVQVLRTLACPDTPSVVAPLEDDRTPAVRLVRPGRIPRPHADAGHGRFFLRHRRSRSSRAALWHVPLGQRQGILLPHCADQDRPVVPAAVLLEMAAEAAVDLAPGWVPEAFHDVFLPSSVRLRRTKPSDAGPTLAVAATVRDASGPRALVDVRITRDLLLADGGILRPAHLHARVRVRLGRPPDPARPARTPPLTAPLPPGPCRTTVQDRPTLDGSDGKETTVTVYESTHFGPHPYGVCALWQPPAHEERKVSSAFWSPVDLIDTLLRTHSDSDGPAPHPPDPCSVSFIRELRLHTPGNDVELADRSTGPVVLHHLLPGPATGGREHWLAATAAGRPLVSVVGLRRWGQPRAPGGESR